MKLSYSLVLFVMILFLIPYKSIAQDKGKNDKPTNVVLLLADGIGINQISGGLYQFNQPLMVEKMPFVGLLKTNSLNSLIPDPAAAATAIACGVKTFNGSIGISLDSASIPSILDFAVKKRMKTGILTSASITHETTASFWSHTANSKNLGSSISQLPSAPLDLIIGGGKNLLDEKKENENLLEELGQKGFEIQEVSSGFENFSTFLEAKKLAIFTSPENPPSILEGRKYMPSAADFAIHFLNDKDTEKNGFFLVIVNAHAAWGAKLNDPKYMLSEYRDFDKTLEQVLKFAENDKETLVIATSSYELGGYSINPGSKRENLQNEFTGKNPTGTLVPVFSVGPGANKFTGFFENIDILPKLKELLGWN